MRHALRTARARLSQLAARARWSADRRTLMHFYRPSQGLTRLRVRYGGQTLPVWVRGGTLDARIAEQIICDDSEYRLPEGVEPRVIFDVGANIGATAVYFAATYPEARVVCFEPLPANVELLRRNVEPFGDRVTVVEQGLGAAEGALTYHPSDDPANFGGGTFHGVGADTGGAIELPVTTAAKAIDRLGIDRIDVLKVDTEGAEHAVLSGVPAKLLAGIRVVHGELHGVEDDAVCDLLSATHDVTLGRIGDERCYPFMAVKRAA